MEYLYVLMVMSSVLHLFHFALKHANYWELAESFEKRQFFVSKCFLSVEFTFLSGKKWRPPDNL